MARGRHSHNPFPVYTDLMMCIVGVFVMIMAALIIQPMAKSQKDFHPKAEYLITLTWDDNRDVDLDLWLETADNYIVYYQNKEVVNISLDRDSLGKASNFLINKNGDAVNSGNQEIIAIRAIMPGDYTAAVSYYGGHDSGGTEYTKNDSRAAIDARIELLKVNPTVRLVAAQDIHLTHVGETHNEIAFRIESDGDVTVLPVPLKDVVRKHMHGD